ncbi:hypothetical protein C8T65DRAFT_724501 [Cerioporus squamosus]|nr:hypothetical protein C8T65DRAFT_724501 [Cerioporus squamosus]
MPPRKRAKKSQRVVPAEETAQVVPAAPRRNLRGRRGGLKDMLEMPLDVLMEIFSFMHPKDLLNLARTSKTFRAFLMNRSAQQLWKASIAQVDDLPPCPTYISEPEYINLLFFTYCHICLKSNVQTVYFEFSARYCPSCRPKMFLERSKVSHLFEAMDSVTQESATYLPAILDSQHKYRWHKPEVETLEARWNSMDDVSVKKALAVEYATKSKLVREAANAFVSWRDAQKAKRSAEIRQTKAGRLESIKAKLCQEGMGEDVQWMENQVYERLSFKKQFGSKADALTEKGWNKIRHEAMTYMEGIKKKRIDAARRLVLRSRFELFAKAVNTYRGLQERRKRESDLSPHMVDLAVMDEFKAILDVPGTETVDLSVLEDADVMRNKLDAAHLRWREERKSELTVMVRDALDVPDGVDPLTLACALFECNVCGRADLRYPGVVAHICARGFHLGQDLYGSTASAFWSRKGSRSPWSKRDLSFSTLAASLLRPILEASGLDPKSVTIRDVGSCPARLICEGCSSGCTVSSFSVNADKTLQDKETYTTYDAYDCWTALAYNLKKQKCGVAFGGGRRDHRWKRVNTAEEKAIAAAERDLPLDVILDVDWDELLHGCEYCEFIARRDKMSRHLKRHHDIEATDDDLDAEHCYNHYDGEPTMPEMSLRRYDDGRVKAEYCPTGKKLGFAFESIFPWLAEDAGFDYDDGMWDSDDDMF